MIKRKIYDDLENHLQKPQATVITGMRRVGKTTALRFLLDKIPHQNKLYLDFEKIENRILFSQNNYQAIEQGLKALGLRFDDSMVLALDEIQLVANSPSVIKYLYDTHSIKFILTGSSSYYLKNHFTESLAGRKRIFELFTLGFDEFLLFKGIERVQLLAFARQPFSEGVYHFFKHHYESFLRFGGFPEVVLCETDDDRVAFLKDIINAYIELDIKLLSDFKLSNDLYRLCQLLAAYTGSRIDVSKLSSISGINRNKLNEYLALFEYTYFIHTIPAFTKNKDKEISSQRKIYLSDTGILQGLAQVSSGQVFENAIALQLRQMGEVSYYQKKTGQEIDFILDKSIAIEVKETPSYPDLKTLKYRSEELSMGNCWLVGRHFTNQNFRDWLWGGVLF
ncbi:MAG: ATP-binding protein [Runella sp.]